MKVSVQTIHVTWMYARNSEGYKNTLFLHNQWGKSVKFDKKVAKKWSLILMILKWFFPKLILKVYNFLFLLPSVIQSIKVTCVVNIKLVFHGLILL